MLARGCGRSLPVSSLLRQSVDLQIIDHRSQRWRSNLEGRSLLTRARIMQNDPHPGMPMGGPRVQSRFRTVRRAHDASRGAEGDCCREEPFWWRCPTKYASQEGTY